MRDELIKLIMFNFGNMLTKEKYNQYIPKLRDYFVPFIMENKSDCQTLDRLFKDEFTRSDIIKSAIYYIVNNENVESKSSIDDFLIALNRFFDETVFLSYHNSTLSRLRPFTSLSNEVEVELKKLSIRLREREAFPHLNDEQAAFLTECLKEYRVNRLKSHQVKIIIKLLMLYGFSFDKIAPLNLEDYSPVKRTLKIKYKRTIDRNVFLELPYPLASELESYLKVRKENNKIDSDLLFITENNSAIKNDLTLNFLNQVKIKYEEFSAESILGKNPFTPTGIEKYAIIRMILAGMNQSVIMELTGQKDDIFNYCQNKVNEIKMLDRNRYINHMIRGIVTYDGF